jgi:hypothetical protein
MLRHVVREETGDDQKPKGKEKRKKKKKKLASGKNTTSQGIINK